MCVAGTRAGLRFTLKYAAPEVVHAFESGARDIKVDAAVDIWALGMIAFELLTEQHTFPANPWATGASLTQNASRVQQCWTIGIFVSRADTQIR